MSLPRTNPQRGEIWLPQLPTDPPGKGKRPVVIVSINARNSHPRADTVLVVPLSTSVHKGDVFTHLVLEPGQTGLRERQMARSEEHTSELQSHLNLVCRLLLE